MLRKKLVSMVLSLAMAASAAAMLSVSALADSPVLFDAEFNGTDDTTGWKWKKLSGDGNDITPELNADGTVTLNGFGAQVAGIVFDNPIAISGKTDIVLESRFKMTANNANGRPIMALVGENTTLAIAGIYLVNGKIAYGGTDGNKNPIPYVSDFEPKLNEFYTYKINFNAATQKYVISVTNDDGTEKFTSDEVTAVLWPTVHMVNSIYRIQMAYTWQCTEVVDYIRLYDNSLLPEVTATIDSNNENLNGSTNMPEDFSATLNFTYPITASDMAKITVDNSAKVTKTLLDDGSKVKLEFAGLKNSTTYTVNVPGIGLNKASSFSFSTKKASWLLFDAEFDGTDDTTGWKWKQLSGDGNDITPKLDADGTVTLNGFGSQVAGIVFDNPIAISGKTDIVLESRFKMTAKNANGRPIMALVENVNAVAGIYLIDGKVAYGGAVNYRLENLQVSDFEPKLNEFYTYKINFNAATQKYVISVTNDDGTEKFTSSEVTAVYYPGDWDLKNVSYIQMAYTWQCTEVVDYIKLYDNALMSSYEISRDVKAPIQSAKTEDEEYGVTRFMWKMNIVGNPTINNYGAYIIPFAIFDVSKSFDKAENGVFNAAETPIEDGDTFSVDLQAIPKTAFDTVIYAIPYVNGTADMDNAYQDTFNNRLIPNVTAE